MISTLPSTMVSTKFGFCSICYYPRARWPIQIYVVPFSTILKLEQFTSVYIRKWLKIHHSTTNICLYSSTSPCPLPIKSLTSISKPCELEDIRKLLQTNLETLNDKYDEITRKLTILSDNITSNHVELKASIEATDKKADEALRMANDNRKCKSDLADRIDDLSRLLADKDEELRLLADASSAHSKTMKALTEQLDDQINRNLRQTLIFKDVYKSHTEKTWDDTCEVLADRIHKHCPELSTDFLISKIERAHRGKGKPGTEPALLSSLPGAIKNS